MKVGGHTLVGRRSSWNRYPEGPSLNENIAEIIGIAKIIINKE